MNITFSKDLLERVLSTFFGAAFVAVIGAWAGSGLDAEHLNDLSAWQKLASAGILAGGAAVFSLVKGMIAKNVGDPNSASLIAQAPPPVLDMSGVAVAQLDVPVAVPAPAPVAADPPPPVA